MRLADVVETSKRVAATSARSEKITLIAVLLHRAAPDEVEAVTAFLAGHLRQGRIGVGWAGFDGASASVPEAQPDLFASEADGVDATPAADAAAEAPATDGKGLEVLDVDRAFERLSRISGRVSAAALCRTLAELLRRATAEERDFLMRLALGELRQGALAGLMEEA